jgi:antitoxin ParD1/3/4
MSEIHARSPASYLSDVVTAGLPFSSMSSELESVHLPAELLDEARDAVRRGSVGSVADYVADAVRLRLAKDRALARAAVARLFGGPPPEDVVATVRQRAGLPPRHATS